MLDAQDFPPARQLFAHGFRSRSAKDVPSRHRPLQIEDLERVGAEISVRGPEFREREPVQRLARLLRQRHDRADDVMRLAERHSFFHQISARSVASNDGSLAAAWQTDAFTRVFSSSEVISRTVARAVSALSKSLSLS